MLKDKLKMLKNKKPPPKTTLKADIALTSRDANFTTLSTQTDRSYRNGTLTHRNTTRQLASNKERNTHRTIHGVNVDKKLVINNLIMLC